MVKLYKTIRSVGLLNTIKYIYFETIYNLKNILFRSYSQHDEDKYLYKVLKKSQTKTYIEVGAADPKRFSNTYKFYKKGWTGLLIEPNPNRIKKLKKYRANDKVLNIGISTKKSKSKFHVFFPENVSTFSDKSKTINQENGYEFVETIDIPTEKLSTVISKHLKNQNIDFLSIDTEGFDMVVLKSNNWNKYRPKYLIIESISGDEREATMKEKIDYMNEISYQNVFQTQSNIIFQDCMDKKNINNSELHK